MGMVASPKVYTVLMIKTNECNCEKYSATYFTECYELTSAN